VENQQKRSVLSLDFLAGLIVGEGTFNLILVRHHDKRDDRDYVAIKPNFKLKMNDLETMELVAATFEHHGLAYYRLDIPGSGNIKTAVSFEARGLKRVSRVADLILPYLTGAKREAAQLVADYCAKRFSSKWAWEGYDEEDVATIERLREVNGIAGASRLSLDILRDYMPRSGRRPARQEIVRAAR